MYLPEKGLYQTVGHDNSAARLAIRRIEGVHGLRKAEPHDSQQDEEDGRFSTERYDQSSGHARKW